MTGRYDLKPGLIPFTLFSTCASLMLFMFLYVGNQPTPEAEGFSKELGEGLGNFGVVALSIIYIRSVLKISLSKGSLLHRFIPNEYPVLTATFFQQLMNLLNRTHKHVGALAIGLLLGHALLVNPARWNLFLYFLVVLLIWQGIFGLFLVVRIPASLLKRYGYVVHAQLFSGVLIGLFTAFGHLLVSD